MTTPEPPIHTGEVVPVVPFGKYKGQPIEVLFADPSYREWVLSQPWVKDRFASFHQVIINYGGEPQDSPEHNQMQASFLDDERCFRLAKLLWPGRTWEARKAVTADKHIVNALRNHPQHFSVEWYETELLGRQFEADGWDVVYGFEPPAADVGMLADNPLPCACVCSHADCDTGSSCRPGTPPPPGWHEHEPLPREPYRCAFCGQTRPAAAHATPRCKHERHEIWREDPILTAGSHCLSLCAYSDRELCAWLNANRGGHWYSANWHGAVRVECKPDLGDDFPSVLRQVLRYPRGPADRCCVVVRRARFQAVTWQQVSDMFAASKGRLMELVAELAEEDPSTLGQLAQRWGEPARRIADAVDAVKVLNGESSYIGLAVTHDPATWQHREATRLVESAQLGASCAMCERPSEGMQIELRCGEHLGVPAAGDR